MRWLAVLACLAVSAVGTLLVFVLVEDQPAEDLTAPEPSAPTSHETSEPSSKPRLEHVADQRHGPALPPDADRLAESEEADEHREDSMRYGEQFRRRWYADRDKLGVERHRRMEKLWSEGRRPRGEPANIEKLERLVREYPDTNRAGCAAWELGHHYLKRRDMDPAERQEKARDYWHLAEERYRDTLCEHNAAPAGLSKLALATWIYRHSDSGMARRLLEEIIAEHRGETDHLGKPVEDIARRMLEQLK